mmetsp:Transcript_48876/g.142453  ORF Transcript_48876/g.142453 Transcript_48876/m.142453 type:complete len:557 (+) Transcript_48876:85-1755(+)
MVFGKVEVCCVSSTAAALFGMFAGMRWRRSREEQEKAKVMEIPPPTRAASASRIRRAPSITGLEFPPSSKDSHYLSAPGELVDSADMSQSQPMALRNQAGKTRFTTMKVIFVMVGLPARGKSFISMRMQDFLNWIGLESKIFNVGQHRRQAETREQNAKYFDASDTRAKSSRDALAFEVLEELFDWLDARHQGAAIFDATNSTAERRRAVQQRCKDHDPNFSVIFVESFCNDKDVVEANIRLKLTKSPDYQGVPYEQARADFMARIKNYESVYETLDDTGIKENELSYIKLINLSSHLVAHRVYGLAATAVLPYLMALHVGTRSVWLVRMGRSSDKPCHAISDPRHQFGDLPLSDEGEDFTRRVAAHFANKPDMSAAKLLICSHRRAKAMAQLIDPEGGRTSVRAFLNPMDWGVYEGVRRNDFAQQTDPEFYDAFTKDPVNTRFPGGESYGDFVRRLLPVLVEIEQQVVPCIVIAPLNTLQVLSCYFSRLDLREASEIDFPQHSLIEWRPHSGRFAKRKLLIDDLPRPPAGDNQPIKKVGLVPSIGSIRYMKGPSG